MNNILRTEHLTKRFTPTDAPAVNDVSFTISEGEIFALLGPSGCGKTTTLRIVAGFEYPDAGAVWTHERRIEGQGVHVPPNQRRIGIVFQEFTLFPHMTVLKNVMYGLHHLPRAQRKARALQALRMVGMENLGARKPHELSGGQQQRIALARSMAPAPKLILLDEPFSNLDAALRQTTRAEVKALLKSHGMSALLVTHDQEEALSFADRIGVMCAGSLVQVGTPEEVYQRPATPFVAEFLGRTNLLEATAISESGSTPRARTSLGEVPLSESASGNILVSIRPEHLRLEAAPTGNGSSSAPRGRIVSREFKGHDLTFRVELDGRHYTVQTDYSCSFQVGQAVHLKPTEPAVVVRKAESAAE